MEETGKDLFRKKSLDQLSTPDQLTDYLRVTGPGIWFVVVGIIVLLLGLLIWSNFGNISVVVDVPAKVESGVSYCYMLVDDLDKTDDIIEVVIGDVKMDVDTDQIVSKTMDAQDNPQLYESGYLSPGKNVMVLACKTTLQDGIYEASVTTEKLKPISLLFSKD